MMAVKGERRRLISRGGGGVKHPKLPPVFAFGGREWNYICVIGNQSENLHCIRLYNLELRISLQNHFFQFSNIL